MPLVANPGAHPFPAYRPQEVLNARLFTRLRDELGLVYTRPLALSLSLSLSLSLPLALALALALTLTRSRLHGLNPLRRR